jgi:hypothetical protein
MIYVPYILTSFQSLKTCSTLNCIVEIRHPPFRTLTNLLRHRVNLIENFLRFFKKRRIRD